MGKTSFKLYRTYYFRFIFKEIFKEDEKVKWEGCLSVIPKAFWPPQYYRYLESIIILCGKYSIPECDVKKDDVVFDVGAHFGFFSYFALQKGAKKVYAFEPNPYVYKFLKRNVEIWGDRIIPFDLALHSSDGYGELLIPQDETEMTARLFRGIEESGKKVKVRKVTLDRFVKENAVKRVDFIKIDVEGGEREVIKGARETIKKFKPRMAIAAYHLPDDKKVIPELVLSIRDDYKYKLVNKGEEKDLFFF